MAEQPMYKVGVIARLLDITERRVQQLARDGVIPKPSRGKYDLIPCVQGYIKYLQSCITGNQIGGIDSHAERARLLKAKADKIEIEVKILKSSLIPTEQMEQIICSLFAAVRAKMLALPSKSSQVVATMKSHHEIRQVLTEHVHEALSELAHYDPQRIIEADPEMLIRIEAAAEIERKPVGGSVPPPKQRGKRGTGKMEN